MNPPSRMLVVKNTEAGLAKVLGLVVLCLAVVVGPVEAHVGTNGWPNDINDAYDGPCQPNQDGFGGEACGPCLDSAVGLVRWRVSEPYLSLWLHDQPWSYQTSRGTVAFDLSYKQRSKLTDRGFSSLGTNWASAWFGYVEDQGGVYVLKSQGAEFVFSAAAPMDFKTRMLILRLHHPGPGGQDVTDGFRIEHPDGSRDEYRRKIATGLADPDRYLLTYSYDRHRFLTEFRYYESGPNDGGHRIVKEVIDCDGKTNFLNYAHTITNLVTSIQDPYGRVAQFQYDAAGHLTNIVDTATNASGLTYDNSGRVTNLATPYGNTSFKFTQSAPFQDPFNTNRWVALGGTNLINRSVEITEPNGSKQLYLYRDDGTKLNASSGTDLLPAGFPLPNTGVFSNAFASDWLYYRNSFHWGRQQYAALSAAGKTNYVNLSTTDYQLARLKHWLGTVGANGAAVSDTLSMLREPSPDGTTAGQMTWYDYAGQSDSDHQGDNPEPRFVARILPGGASWFVRQERDDFGNATNIISTYSVGANLLYRTNDAKFAGSFNQVKTEASVRENGSSTFLLRAGYTLNGGNDLLYFTNAVGEITTNLYTSLTPPARQTAIKRPSGLLTTNFFFTSGTYQNWIQQIVDYTGAYTSGAPGNRVRSFTYTNGLVHTYTDPRGLTVTCTWDGLQRLTSLAFPDNTYLSNRFDKLDLVATKDRLGHWRYFTYNSLQQLTSGSDELGRTNFFGYCDCGSLYSVTNALGHVTLFDHDYAGRLTTESATNGSLVTYQYNALGQVTNVLDSAGTSTRFTYNNQGLLTAISNAYGRAFATTYDHRDRATNVVSAAGVSVTNVFDNLDRLLTRGFPDGGVEKFAYSTRGLMAYTNQLGFATLYGRDAFRRLTAVTNANQEIVQASYNPAGDLLTLSDGKNQKTSWAYDVFGLMTARTNDVGTLVATNGYDANWRLTAHWTPAKGLTTYSYDDAGNLTNVNYPVSPDVALGYDALNRLTNLITTGQFTNSYSYTNFGAFDGALANEDGPWPNDTVSLGYANRQRTTLSLNSPLSTFNQTYAYDAARRLTNVTSTAGAFVYHYSSQPSPLIAQLTLPGGSYITNTFDGLARLTSTLLKNSGGGVLNAHAYQYNVGNERTKQTRADGSYVDYSYDAISQLITAVGKESGGSSRLNEQSGWDFDPAGNLNFRTNNGFLQTFNTVSLNQLTTATRANTFTVSGNASLTATNVTVNTLAATRYADATFAKDGFTLTNGTNTFTVIAKTSLGLNGTNTISVNLPATNTFAYDLNGNLRTNGPIIYAYDDANRLVTNYVAGAWKSEHLYDGLSRRRITRDYTWQSSAWVLTKEVRLVWDGLLPIQERDTNNHSLVTYTRGLDLSGSLAGAGGIGGLLARTDNQGSVFYHADGMGNVTALVDAQQTLEGRYLYDPFGRLLGMWGPVAPRNVMRFSSKPVDLLTGDYDFGYRRYSTDLQRWLHQDPIREAGGINLYQFVGNNPLSYVDRDGLDPVTGTLLGVATTVGTGSTGAGSATVLTVSGAGATVGISATGVGAGVVAGALAAGGAAAVWYLVETTPPSPVLYPNVHGGNPIPNSITVPIPGVLLNPGEYVDQEGNIRDANGDIVRDKNGRPVERKPCKLVSNPKHHRNSESPEPKNVAELFDKSILDENGSRYAKDADGAIHRFMDGNDGTFHWAGSTSGRGLHPNKMPSRDTLKRLK